VKTQAGRFVLTCITFFFVSIAWVFFRASDFTAAWMMFGSLFDLSGSGVQLLPTLDIIQVVIVVSALLAAHWYLHEKRLEHAMQDMPAWWVVIIWTIMLFGLILMQGGASAFIYFQF
ncbi:MAG: alginate O-acetyltransferase complex protein AlgI, partial [Nitrospinales bacterium]